MVKGFGRRPFATLGLRPGPALESLPRRKPRGGRGTVWRARLWGFEDRGRLTSEASAMGDARCFQRKRRWLGFSMATMRVAVGVGGRAIGRDFGRGEQLADALDVVRANRAGEQAVVAECSPSS